MKERRALYLHQMIIIPGSYESTQSATQRDQTIIQISIRFARPHRGFGVQLCAKMMLQQKVHTSAKHSYSSSQLHH